MVVIEGGSMRVVEGVAFGRDGDRKGE